MGLYNYCLTLPLFCFSTGLLLRNVRPGPQHLVVVGALALGAQRVSAELREYTAGISVVRRGATLLPLNFDPSAGGTRAASPLLHAWGYYGIARDVISPYLFNADAERPRSRLAFRPEAPLPALDEGLAARLASGELCRVTRRQLGATEPCEQLERPAYRHLVQQACGYDYLLTWAAPAHLAELSAECFHPVFERGRLRIYERRGAWLSPGVAPRASVGLAPATPDL
jgi:hypothetical protein